MTIMNKLKGLKGCTACLFIVCLLAATPAAWAAHEVSQSDITANVLTSTPTQWTSDLTVQWKAPTMGSDILQAYIYKWNNAAAALDDTVFNVSTGRDGTVASDVDPPNIVKSKADLANLDSGDLLYLHIKTWYLNTASGGQPTYSSDVVYGPFLIDNVAPSGTIRIVDASGNDVTSTSNTLIYLKLAASKDPSTVYLSEASSRPTTGTTFPTTDVAWDLVNTSPGTKTLYAWFADSVGNTSSSPATDSFTLLSTVSISPNTATIDLGTGGTQAFLVAGTSATYNWSIINPAPETTGATVAQFSGASTSTNSVTVQGLAKGTFKLQATPTGTGDTLTSGTITVTQSVKPGDVNGDGDITLDDVKLAFGFFLGATSTSQQFAATNVYDDSDGNTSISLHDVKGVFTLFLGGTL